jgi:hypothetical protein
MRHSSLAVAAAAGALATLGLASPATADPGNASDAIVLVCDNGHTYNATVAGNGAFTPAHDLGSNSILVPTAFGEIHGTVTDAGGAVLAEFTDAPTTKGKSTKARATSTTCTFSFSQTGFDEEFGQVVTFSLSGSVTGFVTPAR